MNPFDVANWKHYVVIAHMKASTQHVRTLLQVTFCTKQQNQMFKQMHEMEHSCNIFHLLDLNDTKSPMEILVKAFYVRDVFAFFDS